MSMDDNTGSLPPIPTPAEIAAKALVRAYYPTDDAYFGTVDEQASTVIAALSEHYHLLPKAEVETVYAMAYPSDDGNFTSMTNPSTRRPSARTVGYATEMLEQVVVAQRLQSRWAAADVAEEWWRAPEPKTDPTAYLEKKRKKILDHINEDVAEARFVGEFNRTMSWKYSDGEKEARSASERRFGAAYADHWKILPSQRVNGPHTVIKFSGQYPALTREMQFMAKNDPARTIRIMNVLALIASDTKDPGILNAIAAIWPED
ncbi:hypothetical protein SEA_MAREELIH_8 [Gordonia phage Mareelih]|nr:hypothetical protein SEA_MAREELIH_8 [Gordonia phage Mareelih]